MAHFTRVLAARQTLRGEGPKLGVANAVAAGDARLGAGLPVRLQRPPLGPAMLASPPVNMDMLLLRDAILFHTAFIDANTDVNTATPAARNMTVCLLHVARMQHALHAKLCGDHPTLTLSI